VNIFGLPSRTVEDILADLLKQNRISLRLETGEVEILNRPTLRRRHRPGLPIDVWQDDFTGAILPLKKVFMYANQEEVRQVAHFKSVIDGSAGFLDMPDSRILAMLAPFDRAMRVSHEGWVPEKLREKTRVGFVPIYAPVAMVNVNDLEIPFIDAPYLPAWLTKIWSRELSEGSEVKTQAIEECLASTIIETASNITRDKKVRAPAAESAYDGSLEAADPSFLVKRWANAIAEVLDCSTDFRALLSRLHQADLRFETLEANISLRGSVRLVEKTAVCHLTELWKQTRRVLIIVTSEWTTELLQRVAAATVGYEDQDAHLILIDCAESPRKKAFPALKELFLKTRNGEVEFITVPVPTPLSFCVSDGQRARLGSIKSILLTNSSAIESLGFGAAEALFSPVVQKIDAKKGSGRWFLSQLGNTGETDDNDPELTAKLRGLLGRMEAFHDDLRMRIQALADAARAGATGKATARSQKEGLPSSFREIEPVFSEQRDEFLAEWNEIDLQIPQMIGSGQDTFLQFCQRVSIADRQHELEIFLSGIHVNSTKAIGRVLLKALNNGTRIALHLTHPASGKSKTRLNNIYGDVVAHSLFSVDYVRAQLPSIVIADEKYVGISSGN